MNSNWLKYAGEIDGYIMTAAAMWGAADHQHVAYALLVGGIAGAVGAALNSVAFFLGQPAPVPPAVKS